jgi:hypothetical protein
MIIESKSIDATIKYIEQDGVVALVNILSRMELQRAGEEDTFATAGGQGNATSSNAESVDRGHIGFSNRLEWSQPSYPSVSTLFHFLFSSPFSNLGERTFPLFSPDSRGGLTHCCYRQLL